MKFTVEVSIEIEVEVDESKFDKEFMDAFKSCFYNFNSIEDHVEHLAQLRARGLISDFKPFVEGYGELESMGIRIGDSDNFETTIMDPESD